MDAILTVAVIAEGYFIWRLWVDRVPAQAPEQKPAFSGRPIVVRKPAGGYPPIQPEPPTVVDMSEPHVIDANVPVIKDMG